MGFKTNGIKPRCSLFKERVLNSGHENIHNFVAILQNRIYLDDFIKLCTVILPTDILIFLSSDMHFAG